MLTALDFVMNYKFDRSSSKKSTQLALSDPKQNPFASQNIHVVKTLSQGKFPVYLTRSKVNNQSYAMKVFQFIDEKSDPYYDNEVRFAILKHPHIIDMVHFEDERKISYQGNLRQVSYILTEYAPHGDFFDLVSDHKESLNEKLVRTYFRQLISGIEYLQSKFIAHLDLKPENLLLGADLNLKIADFDLSLFSNDESTLSKGTKYYRAPEFFTSGSSDSKPMISFPADIYSAGIILFILVSGGIYPHYENRSIDGFNPMDLLYHNNQEFWNKHCEIQEKSASFYSKDFKELFNSMVRFNPEERITIREIKQSKWYKGPVYTPGKLEKKMKKILKNKVEK